MLSSTQHMLVDIAAWLAALALAAALLARQRRRFPSLPNARAGRGWFLSLAAGSIAGSYGLGTANLWLSGHEGVSRSILGAIAGAILAVELYKRAVGLRGSTGGVLAAPLALGIAIGRIGCHLAGLGDFTYGVPTNGAWVIDMGDGVPRWPVALIEAGVMAATALGLLLWWGRTRTVGLARALAPLRRAAAAGFGADWFERRVVQVVAAAAALGRSAQTGRLAWNVAGVTAGLAIVVAALVAGGPS